MVQPRKSKLSAPKNRITYKPSLETIEDEEVSESEIAAKDNNVPVLEPCSQRHGGSTSCKSATTTRKPNSKNQGKKAKETFNDRSLTQSQNQMERRQSQRQATLAVENFEEDEDMHDRPADNEDEENDDEYELHEKQKGPSSGRNTMQQSDVEPGDNSEQDSEDEDVVFTGENSFHVRDKEKSIFHEDLDDDEDNKNLARFVSEFETPRLERQTTGSNKRPTSENPQSEPLASSQQHRQSNILLHCVPLT